MSKQIDKMVNRFLGWKLPQDFAPDAGISFDREYGEKWGMPTGTNLLHAGQARAMLAEVAPPDEEALTLMEETANMLRGMTMDPAIPAHAKEAMRERITTLESAVESRIDG